MDDKTTRQRNKLQKQSKTGTHFYNHFVLYNMLLHVKALKM